MRWGEGEGSYSRDRMNIQAILGEDVDPIKGKPKIEHVEQEQPFEGKSKRNISE